LSFLLRWAVALVLVFVTFNPTDYSYYRWVAVWDGENIPLKALAGIVLLILYVIFFRATWRSIGPIGVTLAAGLMAVLIWVTIDFGLLDLNKPTIVTWVLLFAIATILAIGISWSHIRRRVSGQADMDDVED
jgi:membrane-associated HD superfamily phosphohydrolase